MNIAPVVSGFALARCALAQTSVETQLVRTFIGNVTSYGIHAPHDTSAGEHILRALGRPCASVGTIVAAPAPDVPDKWLINDKAGMHYQLWASDVHGDAMQRCLEKALIRAGDDDRLDDNISTGCILGVIMGVVVWGGMSFAYRFMAEATRRERGPYDLWLRRYY